MFVLFQEKQMTTVWFVVLCLYWCHSNIDIYKSDKMKLDDCRLRLISNSNIAYCM